MCISLHRDLFCLTKCCNALHAHWWFHLGELVVVLRVAAGKAVQAHPDFEGLKKKGWQDLTVLGGIHLLHHIYF